MTAYTLLFVGVLLAGAYFADADLGQKGGVATADNSIPVPVDLPPSSISEQFGKIVTVGDSMFSIYKREYTETLESLLNTTVECNARYGAGIRAIFRQRACSMDPQCIWSVMNDAPARSIGSPQWMQTFESFLQRELDANRKVIIVGYPTFFETERDLKQYDKAMDIYANAAADHDNVWFVDPRQNPIWQSSLDEMYARDKKHPSAKGQRVFASEINKIIRAHSPRPNPPLQPIPSPAPTTPLNSPTTQPRRLAKLDPIEYKLWGVVFV